MWSPDCNRQEHPQFQAVDQFLLKLSRLPRTGQRRADRDPSLQDHHLGQEAVLLQDRVGFVQRCSSDSGASGGQLYMCVIHYPLLAEPLRDGRKPLARL